MSMDFEDILFYLYFNFEQRFLFDIVDVGINFFEEFEFCEIREVYL